MNTAIGTPEQFPRGTRVVINKGEYAGIPGTIEGYNSEHNAYLLTTDEGSWLWADPSVLEVSSYQGERLEDVPTVYPQYGMTSPQLAAFVSDFIGRCSERVLGVGHEQYAEEESQRFEDLPLGELVEYLSEELQDIAVYAAMLDIRLHRWKQAMKKSVSDD